MAFAEALQRENRFEVVSLSREESLRHFHVEAVSAAAALPHDLLATLKREFAADAVIFIDVTTYNAYRPLALGLRAKLATLDQPRLVWTFDTIFSADNPTTANSARHFFLGRDRAGVPADLTPAVLQSPGRFAAYAAAAMFATLPPVTLPPPARPPRLDESDGNPLFRTAVKVALVFLLIGGAFAGYHFLTAPSAPAKPAP